jgi:hypothetical protein
MNSVKSLRIPASVEDIGKDCFDGSSQMRDLVFEPGSKLKRIRKKHVSRCQHA